MALWLATSPAAQAHIEKGEVGGFASGFKHPWSGLDHIAAMVAVGLWGAQLGTPAIWLLPVTFPLIMAIGGFMGLVGIPLPGVEIGIGASALLLGIMVAGEVKPKTWSGPRSWSGCSACSTGTPTARSCHRAKAACFTASAL